MITMRKKLPTNVKGQPLFQGPLMVRRDTWYEWAVALAHLALLSRFLTPVMDDFMCELEWATDAQIAG